MPRNKCCNPYGRKTHPTIRDAKKLRAIAASLVENLGLAKESLICDYCRIHFSNTNDATEKKSDNHIETPPLIEIEDMEFEEVEENTDDLDRNVTIDEHISKLNELLSSLCISPIIKRIDLRSRVTRRKKVKEIKAALDFELKKVFDEVDVANEDDSREIVSEIQEKMKQEKTKSSIVRLLTMVPKTWGIRQLQKEFGVSYTLARKAYHLHQKEGLGSSPNPHKGKPLPEETMNLVLKFYHESDVSRILPGKKDYVSCVKNGKRIQVQKHLLLGNLRELHSLFQEKYPDCQISLSKFTELRPKECVSAGSNGTHNVCVCKIHQNVKLMIDDASLEKLTKNDDEISYLGSYKNILKKMVCDPSSSSCNLLNCENCTGISKVTDDLIKLFDDNCIDAITYRSWVSTDSTSLQTCIDNTDEFIEKFLTDMQNLLKHDFIAKQQNNFFSDLEKSLQPNEFIVKGDFAENYSIVIQDAIQAQYWVKEQVTIHPFVVYYKDGDELKHNSFAVISENLHHDSNAVNLFIQKLIIELKKIHCEENDHDH